jgi:hypothetical protein
VGAVPINGARGQASLHGLVSFQTSFVEILLSAHANSSPRRLASTTLLRPAGARFQGPGHKGRTGIEWEKSPGGEGAVAIRGYFASPAEAGVARIHITQGGDIFVVAAKGRAGATPLAAFMTALFNLSQSSSSDSGSLVTVLMKSCSPPDRNACTETMAWARCSPPATQNGKSTGHGLVRTNRRSRHCGAGRNKSRHMDLSNLRDGRDRVLAGREPIHAVSEYRRQGKAGTT